MYVFLKLVTETDRRKYPTNLSQIHDFRIFKKFILQSIYLDFMNDL